MNDERLSQAELDALVQQFESEEENDAQAETDLDVDHFLTPLEQDTLAEIGNISMGSAATALSTVVNKKVSITVPSIYMSTPGKLTSSYPVPCIIVNVEYLQGLQGENILVIREKDALIIGNLMLGEDGSSPPEKIDEMYLSALTEAMNMMMGSAATAMSDLFTNSIEISPPTTERRNLATDPLSEEIPKQDPVVTVAFRMEIEGLVDSTLLQIIGVDFAKDMVEQLLPPETKAELQETEPAEEPALESEADSVSWEDLKREEPQAAHSLPGLDLGNLNVDLIRDIPVRVRAVLGRTRMSIENILRLGPGHIMELESLHNEPIEIFANDTLIARGEVVVVGEQFGVRITEISTHPKRIGSIR
ncbi:MAG: flagellar motor switch phosphatase FliY [Firmicutes bacterium]|nr:flagellar motor switch phosphatase FliY [Bacillota bacterium]